MLVVWFAIGMIFAGTIINAFVNVVIFTMPIILYVIDTVKLLFSFLWYTQMGVYIFSVSCLTWIVVRTYFFIRSAVSVQNNS